MLQLENYVYLNERQFVEEKTEKVKDDLTDEESHLLKKLKCKWKQLDKKDLIEVIEMICLLTSCWHTHIEHICANPNNL